MSAEQVQDVTLGKHRFEAEVSQLLSLLAGALYKNKEVFLRELISNASDATDKLRFLGLSNPELLDNRGELKIVMVLDEVNKTISINDNGIGMNLSDLIENLGTIARSGTKNFVKQLTEEQASKSELIGQFGVGFYSAFVVADKVEVITKKAGENQAYSWISNGSDDYSIEEVDVDIAGTSVILHLKEEASEFLQEWRIKQIIKRYADHISLPVYLKQPVVKDDASAVDAKADAATDSADVKTDVATEFEEVLLNEAKALWTKAKKDINSDQYVSLYQHVSHDTEEPLAWAHHHVEGKLSYISLLYIPKNRPFDLWSKDHRAGLKLYVKRVFILDEADQFLPMYLRFVKGVIDTADLPLNVSREMLQDSAHINTMKQACIKRVLDLLANMAKNQLEDYRLFWSNFGAVLKEGVAEDFNNKAKLLELLRFNTTNCDDDKQTVSLADYVSRMGKDQQKIYYCIADSHAACKNSPHLEVFKSNNIEVLLLSDRIDEWLMSHAQEFDGKKFQSVAKGDLDFLADEADKDDDTNVKEDSQVLVRMQKTLEEQVKSVKFSSRLTDSAACLIVEENDMSTNLQRILQEAGQDVPKSKPILEINPNHPIVTVLEQEAGDDRFAALAQILLDQATLAEGGQLADPARYVRYIDKILRDVS